METTKETRKTVQPPRSIKKDMEQHYRIEDPWGFKTSAADLDRKQRILDLIRSFCGGGTFGKALDLACGEGWITSELPADVIHGLEISDKAAGRFPLGVKRVSPSTVQPPYDLVLISGALYPEYDWQLLVDLANRCAAPGALIVTCNIAEREVSEARDRFKAELLQSLVFSYAREDEREFQQSLKAYRRRTDSAE